MEGILDLMRARFAVKRFDGPAEDWKVEKIIEAVRLSPSSYNIQPWRLFIVKGGNREKLREHAYGQEQITTASHIVCFLTDRHALESAPEHVRKWAESRGDVLAWLEKQVYIALGVAIVQAEALGVGACPMEGFDEEKWREALGISDRYKISAILALGKKPDTIKEKQRLDSIVIGSV